MHRMRCLIRTLKDTTKEAKLHEGSASSLRLSGDRLSGFHPTRPKRGGGYGCSPPHHAGNLIVSPSYAKATESKTARIIPYRKIKYKRKFVIIEFRIWCEILRAQTAPLIFGIGRHKRNRLRRKKGTGIRDEQRGRARRISCGVGDPERGGTAQTDAEARRRGRGRYSDPFQAPASAHGCAALRRERDRWRSRDAPKCRQRASCNRGLHRPPRGTDRCEKPRTAKRPPPKAIFRLSGNAPQKAKLSEGRFGKAEPEGCASIRGRTQRGVRFSRGSTVGPMQPADSGTASRSI